MKPERRRQIQDLYREACTLDESSRAEFLSRACKDDEDLRREIESLFAPEKNAARIIEAAAMEVAARLVGNESLEDATSAETLPVGGTLSAGSVIGPYHLLQLIGEGGMGQVWLAEQKEPVRRRVALKLIKVGMDTREVVARFQSERQALAMMDHPAIAKVFDAGSTLEGRPYFVMEYVPGLPITTYCDEHKLTLRQRLELFIQVCEGVQHAHQKAIIHRDLKPSNILVTEIDGKPVARIIDFGVAKAAAQPLTPDTILTRLGSALGTLGYMSPEQADFAGAEIDARSDVYSLGVVLYELMAGSLPLDFRKLAYDQVLRCLREQDPQRPSTRIKTGAGDSAITSQNRGADPSALVRQLRGDPDAIALKALEKDRKLRYAAASDLAADIARYLNHQPIRARPARLSYRARKFLRRHRPVVSVIFGAALVLLVIAGGVAMLEYGNRSERFNLENKQVTRLTADGKSGGLIAISPDGRYVALVVSDAGEESLRVRQVATHTDIQILPPKPGGFTGVSFSPDGNYLYFDHTWEKNFNFNALYRVPSLGGAPIQVHPLADTGAGFSPEGQQIAFAIGDPQNRLWQLEVSNPDGSKLRTLAAVPAEILWLPVPAWSPDGKNIALSIYQRGTGQHSLLTLVSTTDGKLRNLLAGSPGEDFGQAVWLPDGRGLLLPIRGSTPDLRGQIWFVSYPDGKRRRFTNDPTDYSLCCLSLSADGKTLAVTQNDLIANLWLAQAQRLDGAVQITSGDPHPYATWLSNSTIVTRDADRRLVLMDRDGRYVDRLAFQPAPSHFPSTCGDGRYFVYVSEDESGSSLWRAAAPHNDTPGGPLRLSSGDAAANPSCSPDGKWVVYDRASNKGYSVIRVSIQGGDSLTLSQNAYYAGGPSTRRISPDSKMVAVDSEDWQGLPSKLDIRSLDTGTPLHSFVRPAELPFVFQWAPDGQSIDYVQTRDGVGNVWEQRLTGGAPKQLTHFTSDQITDFDWSPDGKQLLTSRGHTSSNVFLLSNFH